MGSKANKVDSAPRENFITAEIKVEDASKSIRLFNSYENANRDYLEGEFDNFSNEDEIKKNIEIKSLGTRTEDPYLYKFQTKGKYKIIYSFKKKLTNINSMFYSCDSIIKLDLSNFNTENVTNMSKMFFGCESLTSLNLSNFNTKNVTDMSSMFSCCRKLKSLDLTNFNTENVTNMDNMFYFCKSLTSLNLSSFNFGKVNNMENMFAYCSSLKKLVVPDLDSFNNKTNNIALFDDVDYLPKIISSNSDKCCDCF